MTLTTALGAPSRRMIAVAATGSVGESTAPRAKAAAQGMSITSCAATATAQVVTRTSPIDVRVSARADRRRARRSAKKAAA